MGRISLGRIRTTVGFGTARALVTKHCMCPASVALLHLPLARRTGGGHGQRQVRVALQAVEDLRVPVPELHQPPRHLQSTFDDMSCHPGQTCDRITGEMSIDCTCQLCSSIAKTRRPCWCDSSCLCPTMVPVSGDACGCTSCMNQQAYRPRHSRTLIQATQYNHRACLVPQEQVAAVAAGGDELVLRAREGDALYRLRIAVACATPRASQIHMHTCRTLTKPRRVPPSA